jgi:hypothetical protein
MRNAGKSIKHEKPTDLSPKPEEWKRIWNLGFRTPHM